MNKEIYKQIYKKDRSFYSVSMKCDGTLQEQLKKSNLGDLGFQKRLEILLQVGKGLKEIHGTGMDGIDGMCHQDIKPSNVFVNLDDLGNIRDVMLGDYGIGDVNVYVDHHSGTPGWGSPELFIARADRESDIFSFGKLAVVTLFPWDIGWEIMSSPVGPELFQVVQQYPILKHFQETVTLMLQVLSFSDTFLLNYDLRMTRRKGQKLKMC